jgi:hypothetical protein
MRENANKVIVKKGTYSKGGWVGVAKIQQSEESLGNIRFFQTLR